MSRHNEQLGSWRSSRLRALEECVERELSVLGTDRVTAFVLRDGVGLAVELDPALHGLVQPDALASGLTEVAREEHAQTVLVVLLEPGALPRGRSGQRQRLACSQRWREGTLGGFAVYREGARLPFEPAHGAAARRGDVARSGTAEPSLEAVAASEVERALEQIWAQVLRARQVPRSTSFFALGGSSVDVAQMLARAQERFGVGLDAALFFAQPTLAGLASNIERLQNSTERAHFAPIPRVARNARLPLSAAQRRMRFLWQLAPESGAYNICGALRLEGALDTAALEQCLDALVERHEALRTRFPEQDGEPWQQIDPPAPLLVERRDLQQLPLAERDRAGRASLQAAAEAPFDLERGPLLRALLLQLGEEQHWLALTLHHSIGDGASMNLLTQEFAQLYAAFSQRRASPLAPLELQYADYAAWQAARLAAGEAELQLEYFRELLGLEHPLLELPADQVRPARPSGLGQRLEFVLAPELVERARALGRARDASLFMVLLTAFELLLHRHTGQRDLRIGVPAANRSRLEAGQLFGAFVNTQVLRAKLSQKDSLLALLEQNKQSVLGAQQRQDLPFDELVEALSPERSLAHHPLFQVMFNHQERDTRALGGLPGLRAEVLDVEPAVTRFDLSLNTREDETGRLSAAFVYASELFAPSRIEQLGRHFTELLEELVQHPERTLAALEWPTRADRQQLEVWSQARAAVGDEALQGTAGPDTAGLATGFDCVPEQIARQMAQRPDACALCFGAHSLSYAELERRSAALAAQLRAAGAGPDVIVGVLVPRSIELVVSVLAVLQAGAAYLALDPEHPAARLEYLLQDSGARILLCEPQLSGLVPERSTLARVELEPPELAQSQSQPRRTGAVPRPHAALQPNHLAYVLYTSGSTGQPKAVGNTHGALRERLAWMQREYRIGDTETLLHKTPLTFDVAVWEILLPLLSGARLALAAPGEHRDPRELVRRIRAHGVSTIHFVPSLLEQFVQEDGAAECTSLRRLFSGGEMLGAALARRVRETLPSVRLDNRYGPTEALINASYWTCSAADVHSVPIGTPIPNGTLRVLDAELRPLPAGVPGELYLGGSGLARGYLGRPALTAERFLPDPFAREPGQRLYRTGDGARFRNDGVVEYLGRSDEQVKVRGIRIELGELEAALSALPGVRAAAAALRPGPDGAAVLVGYVVADAAQPLLELSRLREQLERQLPAPLLPSHLVQLEQLPLLSSGKLHRAALPAPEHELRPATTSLSALQARVAAIWSELLGVSPLDTSSDFFALGGHSLLATRVVARVRVAFDIELPLRDLFEARDLGAFSRCVERALAEGRRATQPPLTLAERDRPLALSHAQERMWFLWQLEPESSAYNVAGAVQLGGALNVPALERALGELGARHEALRTTFPQLHGAPVQQIAPHANFPFECVDLRTLATAKRDAELQRHVQAEAGRPFDLARGPLWRVLLVQLEDRRHVLAVTLHHIVAEGWAMDVFARECVALYEAFSEGRGSPLEPLRVQYADYAAWQRRWLASGEGERQLDFWRRTLGNEHPVLNLPADRPRPPTQSFRGDYHHFRLERGLAERVRSLGERHGSTLPMTLMTALFAFLHRYSGQRDLRLGYPIANRIRPEFEGLIGAFLNTQVLRVEVTPELRGLELLERVKNASLDAQSHQDVPFHRIVEALEPERSAAHTPLFQVMCNVQRWKFQERRSAAGLELQYLANDARAAQFDLALDISEVDTEIECALSYSLDLFDAATAARMAAHWVRLLEGLTETPEARIGELALLTPSERQSALATALGPRGSVPAGTLHGEFAAAAERWPERIAVVHGSQSLSFGALDARAERWAEQLRALGVGPDVLVGLHAERSLELVAALLGVLKAGGAYLPLDPEYPSERLRYLLEDSGARLVLSSALDRLPPLPGELCLLDLAQGPAAQVASPVLPHGHDSATADQLAYCIYTSGSTGQPKGVLNSHGALLNRLRWMQAEFGVAASDRVLQKTSLSFDVSAGEILWPLLSGALLVLASAGAERDPAELSSDIVRHGVSCADFVPAQLGALVAADALARCSTLRLVTVGGEALPPELARQFFKQQGTGQHGALLYNMYGPTEAAVDVAYWRCQSEANDSSIPIGQPEANTSLYVLDSRLEPVPARVTGELYIGGVGLARGYHGRTRATSAAFVPDPFSVEPGRRLYRTGDLARRRPDGVLEFVGRADTQVKVRGYRIELGEVEARLLEDARVSQAAVLVRQGQGGSQLVGYVVAAGQSDSLLGELRLGLRAQLPDYMVPSWLVLLDALPLLQNGKLDLRALPEPTPVSSLHYAAPESELELRLAAIWCGVLGVERVGLDDNFFELGGDSIISLTLVHRAREQGLELSPRQVFQHQTLRALGQVVQERPQAERSEEPATGVAALTPVQQRFFSEVTTHPEHYNQAVLLEPRRALDPVLLARALAELVRQHASLRLRYVRDAEGAWQQEYADLEATGAAASGAPELLWVHNDAADGTDGESLAVHAERAQRSLDLGAGPLLRAVWLRHAGSERLLVVIHHLVVDGVSWRILLQDLEAVYLQLEAGQTLRLPAPTSSYQAWGARLQQYAASTELHAQLDYWRRTAEPGDALELPRDHACDTPRVAHAEHVSVSLDGERTAALLRRTPEAYRTQVGDLLLTALARVLCRWAQSPAVWVELEGHGREDRFGDLDLSRSVGWFTSLFPVRLAPALAEGDQRAAILAVKEQLREVPERGFGYGVLRYLAAPTLREALANGPRPRVTFNYLGQLGAGVDSGLFALASEECGPNRSGEAPLDNWLSIDAQVDSGQLTLRWTYSREMYEHATIAGLAEQYREELVRLIEHCLAPEARAVTPSDFPLAKLSQEALDRLPWPAQQLEDVYPLSPLQQGLLFHSLYSPEAGLYVSQLCVDTDGLDVERFRRAWQSAIDRHEILRTGFVEVAEGGGGGFVQVVQKSALGQLEELAAPAEPRSVAALEELAQAERQRGFELTAPPLSRVLLVGIGPRQHRLIWTHHHLLLDGWSSARLMEEVLRSYAGEAPARKAGSYRQYIEWLSLRDSAADEAFWRAQLRALEQPTLLASALPKKPEQGGHAEFEARWSPEQQRRWTRAAQSEKVTLNVLVQAAWLLLLQRYTGQSTVALGQTVAGRPPGLPGAETTLGLFINTLPVIQSPRAAAPLRVWLAQLAELSLSLGEHEHTPLAELQRWAGRPGQTLFDTLLVFENYPLDRALRERGGAELSFGPAQSVDLTHYALTLEVSLGEHAGIEYKYAERAFARREVQALAAQLEHLLDEMSAHPERALGSFELFDDVASALSERSNDTAQPVRPGQLQEWIAAQAAQTPDALALVYGAQSLSYAALDARANQLARVLRERGVGPDQLVGICVERSLELVVGLLAILKAGAAYVPLDPGYPSERLRYMIEDSALGLLLTSERLAPSLPETAAQLWCLDRDWHEAAAQPSHALPPCTGPQHLAYCIYTSGSTGRPKGVQIEHWGVSNYLSWALDAYRMSELDSSALHSSIAFDLSVTSLWLPLCAGKHVLLSREDGAALEALADDLSRSDGAGLLKITPSHALALAELLERPLPRVRALIVGGEALSWECVAAIARFAPEGRVVNEYGPTEAVVGCCVADADAARDRSRGESVPIGAPIANTQLFVLDSAFARVPLGVAGELCIAGGSLARGYGGQPGLTAQRFVPHPFANEPGQRLYRTGDLARYRDDGVLEYLGRIDQQVKVRGYRIELGEIESRLCELPGVREAAVLARETPSGKQLLAYVVTSDSALDEPDLGKPDLGKLALRERELSEQLGRVLPEYMLPARILLLAALPLTPNGKLDRAALPAPDTRGRTYAEPEGEHELRLAEIWSRLLGVARVGRDDNFDLGGDSIVSLQVVSRARAAGLALTPRDVFSQQTIAALARVAKPVVPTTAQPAAALLLPIGERLRAEFSETELAALPRPASEIEDFYALSPLQQGMLFHALYEPGSGVYVSQLSVAIEGLDASRFAAAWQSAIARHPSLRTSLLAERERGACQLVWKHAPLPLRELDWRERAALVDLEGGGLEGGSLESELDRLASSEHEQGFDLARAPLQRLLLVRLAENQHRLIWTFHHLLLDGWSSARLIEEVLAHSLGRPASGSAGRYGDYIRWLGARDVAASERFWRSELVRLDEPTLLAGAVPRPAPGTGQAELTTRLDAAESAALLAFAQRQRITPSTLLQGAWLLLLQRYTGQSSVACGVTVAGRPPALPGIDDTLGLFINTLPLIESPRPEHELGAWLRALQDHNLALREFEHTPLYDVQRWGGRAGQALFDSLVVFENYPVDRVLRAHSGEALRLQPGQVRGSTSYPLTLEIKAGEQLELHYGYTREHFDAERMVAIDQHLRQLLSEMRSSPDQKLAALGLATAEERSLLRAWNETRAEYAGPLALHHWFEAQVARTPDAIALVCGRSQLSYAQLDARAAELALRLQARGVGPDVLVGVCAERSLALVIGLLGILKAGGAYVPLDPEYPRDRLAYMLEDSAVELVLGEARALELLPAGHYSAWALDADLDEPAGGGPAATQPTRAATQPEHLAYCIYTSGSTGKPKAAGNSHRALHNRLAWMQAEYRLTARDRVLQKTPFSFDVSVWEFFWPLVTGACLVLAPPGAHRDPAELGQQIARHGITTLHFVPSMLQAFVDAGALAECSSVRQVLSSGEALPLELTRRCLDGSPARLHNLYGPTEAAIDVSYWECQHEPGRESVPIGRPIGNLTLHVLDAALEALPPGVVGELYIGGVGLARGYHRRPALTAERFVPDAVSGNASARLYRTGDLARFRDDGAIEYVGRIDHQVKLRGFRIELGEIEARLREQPRVRDAVVVARDAAGKKQLIGYVAATETDGFGLALREALRLSLPEYMVPAQIVVLDALPLTASGKLDRRALPAPDWLGRAYAAPEGTLEELLAEIWRGILHAPRVGRDDNFFDLGGDSIVSLQVVARAREQGWSLTPRDVFREQTVAALAKVAQPLARAAEPVAQIEMASPAPDLQLELRLRAELSPAEQELLPLSEIRDLYALSPMQQGMLFHASFQPNSSLYVNQLRVGVHGLDVARFRAAWDWVVLRHDSLRTAFLTGRSDGRRSLQLVLDSVRSSVEEIAPRGPGSDRAWLERLAREELERGFDLARPPLQRVVLAQLGEAHHELIWTYHHALLDGWSSARLIEEVLGHYLAAPGAQQLQAPGRYRHYIDWLEQQDASESERFWTEQLATLDTPTLLAAALPSSTAGAGYAQYETLLGAEPTRALLEFARRERVTLNTLLQAAWALLLVAHTDQSRVVFGATVAGRPASLPGVESLLGLFINTLPVQVSAPPSQQVGPWLRELQSQNLALREHEHTPLYDVQRWSGRAGQALFDTLLVFENYPIDQVLHAQSGEQLRFDPVQTLGSTHYALSLEVATTRPGAGQAERLHLSYGYLQEHFDTARVQALDAQLQRLLCELSSSSERALGTLEWVTGPERSQLQAWGTGPLLAKSELGVHELFEEQARRAPDRIAVVCGERRLSYAALNARAEELAQQLTARGVGPEVLVGVCLERSLSMLVGVLAVWKAGGGYLPLDPEYPRERLGQLIESSGVRLILTETRFGAALPASSAEHWYLD